MFIGKDIGLAVSLFFIKLNVHHAPVSKSLVLIEILSTYPKCFLSEQIKERLMMCPFVDKPF
jgi:hypothetical protein